MHKPTRMTAALVVAVALAATWSLPAGADHTPICEEDFTIPTTEPPSSSSLPASGTQVGKVEVSTSSPKDVTVSLESIQSDMEFRINYLDGTNCLVASGTSLTLCEHPEILETGLLNAPLPEECDLEDHSSSTRVYFFELKNVGTGTLQFKIWES